ncbi:chorismate mutase [Fusobacterium sp. MFO224]|uniref:chorismate mutase n=1 Tax=Fusobacterium sp. MFO224 TaxID=3378070 RepID=UPI003851FFC8
MIINKNLTNLRLELDNIDNKIAKLILQRIEIVKQIGNIKKQEKNNFYVPEREEEIFSRLSTLYPKLNPKIIKVIFTEIISASRSYEKIFNIAIKEHFLSKIATQNIFGSFCNTHVFNNINEIVSKDIDYLLIPLDVNYDNLVEINSNFLLLKKIVVENIEFYLFEKVQK